MKKTYLILFIISSLIITTSYPVLAYVMDSGSYRIQSDSLNTSGGRQDSGNYLMEDTVGETATGLSETATFKLKAGYQQMQEIYIAVSSPSDVTMTPTINGVLGGTGNGSADWTVTTDNAAGYALSIKASTSPALRLDATSIFADYTPSNAANPDFTWLILAATSEFGFTTEGTDILQKYKDNGVDTCNAGSNNTADACWYNFTATNEGIADSSYANHPLGTATTVKFRAESGSGKVQAAGNYTSSITITVVAK